MAQINGTAGDDIFIRPLTPAPGEIEILNDDDELIGGAGDDTYFVDHADLVVTEAEDEGTDLVVSTVNYTLGANLENLDLDGAATSGAGNAGANVIRGLDNGTDYILDGGAGNDTIYGNAGDDNIDGGLGADRMEGGAGNDTYYVDSHDDVVIDSAGAADKIYFAGNLGVVNLADYSGIESFEIDSPLNNAETRVTRINGTAGADIVTGNEANNTIYGNDGNDTLNGGDGNDYLDGGNGDDELNGGLGADRMVGGDGNDIYYVDNASDVVVERANQGTDTVRTSVDYALGANVENLFLLGADDLKATGNALDNTITGNAGHNVIDGGRGVDRMIGGDGNDTYIVDNALDLVEEAGGQGTDLVKTSVTYTLSANVENGTATANNVTLTGNGLANVLTSFDSRAGKTTLAGGAGNDTYVLNSKNDVVDDSAGTDTVFINYATGTIARQELALKYAGVEVFLAADPAKLEIVDQIGKLGGASLSGNDGMTDVLDGGTIRGVLRGGTGDDTYIVRNAAQVVEENALGGDDTVRTSLAKYELTANVENLIMEGRARTGTGNAEDNTITGNDAANVIDGGAGEDYMAGGKGNDTYYVDEALDVVVEVAGEGVDKIISSVNIAALAAEVENLDLVGVAADTAVGNGLNNIIRGTDKTVNYDFDGGLGNDQLLGNDGNDILNGGAGDDRMVGGKGDDTYYVDSLKDVVVDTSGTNDRVILQAGLGAVGTYRLAAGIEVLDLDNANAGLNVIGNATKNIITGGTGADTIDGGAGDDTISGGTGADVIKGGAGKDLINGDVGADTISGGAGDDTINGGADGDTIYGDAGNDILNGDAGTDVIYGGAGNDTVNGGADADTIYGDAGNDVLNGDAGADTIYGGAGNDTINGGADADTLYGDAGNDTIDGGLGNDIIFGGAGDDVLTGGAGDDTFVLEARGGRDTITDFTKGDDLIDIADLLTGYTGPADFADFVNLISDGNGGTLVQVDANGATGGARWTTVAVLTGVDHTTLDNTDFILT